MSKKRSSKQNHLQKLSRAQLLAQVSVVVCTRNSAHLLEPNLKHLLGVAPQSELIVVDGNSSDDTLKIAHRYTSRVFSDRGRGLSFARQLGITKAKRPYVAFIGPDDLMPADSLEKLALALDRDEKLAGVQTLTILRHPHNYWEKATKYIFEYLLNTVGSTEVIGTPCLFRRSAMMEIRYDEAIGGGCDDTDVCLRLIEHGYTLKKLNLISYEEQPLQFGSFIKRWQFYGKGDAQFYAKYQSSWTPQRKLFSLTHPLRKYIWQGSLTFLQKGKPELIPALWVGAAARYQGWWNETFKMKELVAE